MQPNSAWKMTPIVVGTDYEPQLINPSDTNLGYEPPIYALLCTESTGSGNVVMRLLGDDGNITIPSTAFKVGVVYYFYLKKLVSNDSNTVNFIGLRYRYYPMIF